MQLSRSILSLLLAGASFGASAQQYQSFELASPGKVIKNDTLVKKRAIAANIKSDALPALNAPAVPAAAKAAAPTFNRKKVPLAGQQAYFGKMTDYMNTFVRQYFGAYDKTLSIVKGRSKGKFTTIENILVKNRIPKELKYLAVIESALNNKALSGAGAMGPWQLMEVTGREMGLTINETRDDRTDWAKSTQAAARYLNFLYGQLDDWLLVVAAYNSGPVPVMRAIHKTGSRNFWDIKKYLPRETQGHVLRFVATASIFEKMDKYIGHGGLPRDYKFENELAAAAAAMNSVAKVEPPKPQFTMEELQSMAIVRISDPIALDFLAQDLGIERKLLYNWNSDYDLFVYQMYTDKYYGLRIPKDKLDLFIQHKEALIQGSKAYFEELN